MHPRWHVTLSFVVFFSVRAEAKAQDLGDYLGYIGDAIEYNGELTKDETVSSAQKTVGKTIGQIGNVVSIASAKDDLDLSGELFKLSGAFFLAAAPETGGLSILAGMAFDKFVDHQTEWHRNHLAHVQYMNEIDSRTRAQWEQSRAKEIERLEQVQYSQGLYPKFKGSIHYNVAGQGEFQQIEQIFVEEPNEFGMWQIVSNGEANECNISININSWMDGVISFDAGDSSGDCKKTINKHQDTESLEIISVCEEFQKESGISSKIVWRSTFSKLDDDRIVARDFNRSITPYNDSGYVDFGNYEIRRCVN